MLFIYPNCTENSPNELNCTILTTSNNGLFRWYYLLVLILSIFGCISDAICVTVFSSVGKLRIFQTLRVFCGISLANNILELSSSISFFSLPMNRIVQYNNNTYLDNKIFAYILSYIYVSVFSILYSIDGAYAIYIIYERILIFKKKWPFGKTSSKNILIGK